MANPEHVEILRAGPEAWNRWREEHKKVRGNFSGADITSVAPQQGQLGGYDANLRYADFYEADFSGANLSGIDLTCAGLIRANFANANLSRARLYGVELNGGVLKGAILTKASLYKAGLSLADLTDADLTEAELEFADLTWARLVNANLSSARLQETLFLDTNLSGASGLSSCIHVGYSNIDHRTLAKSSALPVDFLRGTGLPDILIDCISALKGAPFRFATCFISYSHQDEEFARQLYSDLQDFGVRCWFAPEHMHGGRKIHHQINDAIGGYEKLILVLSEHSMSSDWVTHEIKRARMREKQQGRQVLFPIALCDYAEIKRWELFHAATVTDLAEEVREYFIVDFSRWRKITAYRTAFDQLLSGLKTVVEKEAGNA